MKLRQKLAVVLASAMVITAVPVTTMAASTNGFNKTLSIVADKDITTNESLFLQVKYADKDSNAVAKNGDVFFVNATDFEFDEDAYTAGKFTQPTNATVRWLSETQLKVTVNAVEGATDTTTANMVNVPIVGTPAKGNPAITVDAEDSYATSGKYSLTGSEVVTDKVLSATAGDAKNISVDGLGSIADITIEEAVADSLLKAGTVTITLPNSSDLEFSADYATAKTVTVTGKRGLAESNITATAQYAKEDGKVDEKKLVITFTGDATKTRGSVVLKGIKVQAEDKRSDVSTGEVKVTVAATGMADTKLVVANVTEYGVSFKVDEVEELVAGGASDEVKLTVKENAIDSLDSKKDIYFTIEEGYFDVTSKEAFDKANAEKGLTINEDLDEITLNLGHVNEDKDGKKVAIFTENEINEFSFTVKVGAKVGQEGPVVVTASSKNFEEDMTVEVAKVEQAVKVETEAITVKAGLKNQVGGKIVITETDADTLAKNKEIRIKCAELTTKYGFYIEDATVETTGDIKVSSKVKDGEIIVTVDRTSDEASSIIVKDMKITTDRTIPEGTFDFEIGGSAISTLNSKVAYEDVIELTDFVKVGTKNTEDLPNAATAKEIVLTVNSTAYTVNGETKTADAAAFIDASNRTMVPVRFVAEEFGKIDFGTVNGVGTITIFKDGAVLQFQNGSNIMNKNGIAIPMDTKVVIKDGRTYVPFKYVADGLGINYSFDPATKSITFTNQAQ